MAVIYCNDYGQDPACLGEADPKFTMDFTMVEKGAYIHWCSHCGPRAKKLSDAIDQACDERGPGFIAELRAELDEVEKGRVIQ